MAVLVRVSPQFFLLVCCRLAPEQGHFFFFFVFCCIPFGISYRQGCKNRLTNGQNLSNMFSMCMQQGTAPPWGESHVCLCWRKNRTSRPRGRRAKIALTASGDMWYTFWHRTRRNRRAQRAATAVSPQPLETFLFILGCRNDNA